MAYVEDIICCANHQCGTDVGIVAKTIITNAVTPRLPIMLPMSIILNFADMEFNKEYKSSIRLLDPNGKVLVEAQGSVTGVPYFGVPQESTRTSIAVRLERVLFEIEGSHIIQVFIEGELSKVKELYVFSGQRMKDSTNESLRRVDIEADGNFSGN